MTPWHPLVPGTLLHGRFEVLQALGGGGFAATYVVRDQHCLGAELVLKELRPSATEDRATVERLFVREAETLQRLSHPGVPRLHAFFQWSGRMCIVQERISGQTVAALAKASGPLGESQVRSIVTGALEVLRYLHAQAPALIHRDIKPSNMMVTHDGRVVLIDFGAVTDAVRKTRVDGGQTCIYTDGYASPEQRDSRGCVPASDLYSLGVTAIELLQGPGALRGRATAEHRTALSGLPLSPSFRTILARLVEPDLTRRFAAADDVLAALADATVVEEASARRTIVERADTILEHGRTAVGVITRSPARLVASVAVVILMAAAAVGGLASPVRSRPTGPVASPGPVPPTTGPGNPLPGSRRGETPTTGPNADGAPAPRERVPPPSGGPEPVSSPTSTRRPPPPPKVPVSDTEPRGRPVALGVQVQTVPAELCMELGVMEGALISAVHRGSPAARAGLRAGDVIVAVNGMSTPSPGFLRRSLDRVTPESLVRVRIVRYRREQTKSVDLASLPYHFCRTPLGDSARAAGVSTAGSACHMDTADGRVRGYVVQR